MRSSAAQPPHERGELHRRVSAIVQTGVFAAMSRPGLVVFLQVRQWADFTTCQFTLSLRTLASAIGVSLSTAKRGVDALVAAGVLTERPSRRGDYRTFEVTVPTRKRHRGPEPRGGAKPWE